MFSLNRFRLRHSTFARAAVWSALLLIVALAMFKSVAHRSHAAGHKRQQLTFEDRVAAQRAIEEVYHRRRI